MKKIVLIGLVLGLCGSAFSQLATQEITPLRVQTNESASASVAFTNAVVSGHELIVAYECWNGGTCNTPPTIADTLTTTWTSRISQGSTQCGNLFIWTGQAGSSGADTVTISSGGSFQNLVISEFANLSDTLDVASTATGWSSLTSITSPSITTGTNGDLLFAAMHTCNSGYSAPVQPMLPLTTESSADSTSAGWGLAGANGSYSASFSFPAGGSSGNVAIIAMKPASALQVVTTQIPDASTGAPYSFDLHANAGSGSYTWARIGGAVLPAGLSLSSGGTISGTPTAGNGGASMTFQVTDGASATATKSLTLNVGTSFNSIAAVQNHSVTCASAGNLGTVTSGNLILILYNSIKADVQFTDTLGTVYAALPISFHMLGGGVGSIINWVAWGFAPSTGTDTLNCTGAPILIAATELSNVQKTFDPTAQVITLGSSASPYTSGSMTAPVSETLFSWVSPFTFNTSITTQSPYTAGFTGAGSSSQITVEYQVGAASGSQTASYAASGNTDGHWGIALTAFRPTTSGTAPGAPSRNRKKGVF